MRPLTLGVLARKSLAFFVCSLAALLVLVAPALGAGEIAVPAQEGAAETPAASYLPDQIIVVWEEDASRRDKAEARDGAEVEAGSTLGDPAFQIVEPEPGQSTGEALATLRSDPAVAVAAQNVMLYPTAKEPNDPFFNQQWGLKNTGTGVNGFVGAVAGADINATNAWDFFTGLPGTGAIVADIDSGYRAGPDLGPTVPGFDFVGPNADSPTEDSDPTDDNGISGGHGVHTAGIIGAVGDNATGIAGVAWDAKLMPLRVCAASPKANNALACPAGSIVKAINYAGSHNARVANISLTVSGEGGKKNEEAAEETGKLFREAMAANPQTLFVVAAGNDAANNDESKAKAHYPCNVNPDTSPIPTAIDNVVCVAATNQADALASFSDYGKTSVDLAAPGTEILSTYPLETPLSENFSTGASKWTAGAGGGFVGTSEFPLTSPGFSDSPGEPPAPESVRESTLTTPIALPPGTGNCRLTFRRFVSLQGTEISPGVFSEGKFTYQFLTNGTPFGEPVELGTSSNPGSPALTSFNTNFTIAGLGGSNVQIRLRYQAGPAPAESNGVWLDDLVLTCYQATTQAPGYAFLQGTSMAAPMVSGAAALLFSLQPSASVTTVRKALLDSVHPLGSLSGKTVTGGRLDAQNALAQLDTTPPGIPVFTATSPISPSENSNPRILGTESDSTATVRIYSNGGCSGSPQWSGSAATFSATGIQVAVAHEALVTFSADAIDPAKNVSGCSSPTISYQQEDDKVAPLAPQLVATTPASPSTSATPRILGAAEAGSTVRLYTNELCLGSPSVVASAEALNTTGIPVSVPSSSTATFWATATDAAVNTSLCSTPISYTNSSLIDRLGGEIVNPPPPSSACTVPKLAGKTLAQAKSAITRALCKTGKVTKPKPKPGQKLGPLVVKSSSPAAGAVAASGVVNVKLGPKPQARRARQSRHHS